MMFTLNCVRAWCFYCSINWAVRKSMSSIQALFLSILHLLSPANVHNLILGTLCILLLQLFCQKVELAIISKPSRILLLCFLFIYTDFSWVKFDWFVVFWHTFHHLPVKALGPTNTPWINPRGWRPFREKQINLPWFCQNLWNVTCFIYFAKWVVSRGFSCLLHVCLLFVNCVMLLLCVPASDRSSYFRLFIVSWCQLMLLQIVAVWLEHVWMIWNCFDSTGYHMTSCCHHWSKMRSLMQSIMQDIEYFRYAFVNRKLDNELKSTSNPIFGWRAWSIWNYRKAFKVISEVYWSILSVFFHMFPHWLTIWQSWCLKYFEPVRASSDNVKNFWKCIVIFLFWTLSHSVSIIYVSCYSCCLN